MTSQGQAYSRFRRALLTKNLTLIEAASRELPQVALEDALRILGVLAEKHDDRFERAAARFAARLVLERGLTADQGHRVLALTQAMADSPDGAAELLRRYLA